MHQPDSFAIAIGSGIGGGIFCSGNFCCDIFSSTIRTFSSDLRLRCSVNGVFCSLIRLVRSAIGIVCIVSRIFCSLIRQFSSVTRGRGCGGGYGKVCAPWLTSYACRAIGHSGTSWKFKTCQRRKLCSIVSIVEGVVVTGCIVCAQLLKSENISRRSYAINLCFSSPHKLFCFQQWYIGWWFHHKAYLVDHKLGKLVHL